MKWAQLLNLSKNYLIIYKKKVFYKIFFSSLKFDRKSILRYGFAEYKDQETAMSALRNLNGRDLHGRPLRVNKATCENYRVRFEKLKKN